MGVGTPLHTGSFDFRANFLRLSASIGWASDCCAAEFADGAAGGVAKRGTPYAKLVPEHAGNGQVLFVRLHIVKHLHAALVPRLPLPAGR